MDIKNDALETFINKSDLERCNQAYDNVSC